MPPASLDPMDVRASGVGSDRRSVRPANARRPFWLAGGTSDDELRASLFAPRSRFEIGAG